MHASTIICSLFALASAGCLYTGEGTEGLPCNTRSDCGAQSCIDGFCGGAPLDTDTDTDAAADTEYEEPGDESSSSGQAPPTEQMLPTACTPGLQECVGSNAISICTDDGKLRSFGCEAVCGPDDTVLGGCQPNPLDGIDYCYCASSGGPPSGTCRSACSSDFDCSPGEDCLSTTSGSVCLPSECGGCFAQELICSSYPASCLFVSCDAP